MRCTTLIRSLSVIPFDLRSVRTRAAHAYIQEMQNLQTVDELPIMIETTTHCFSMSHLYPLLLEGARTTKYLPGPKKKKRKKKKETTLLHPNPPHN